jgi:hypothetical protein
MIKLSFSLVEDTYEDLGVIGFKNKTPFSQPDKSANKPLNRIS